VTISKDRVEGEERKRWGRGGGEIPINNSWWVSYVAINHHAYLNVKICADVIVTNNNYNVMFTVVMVTHCDVTNRYFKLTSKHLYIILLSDIARSLTDFHTHYFVSFIYVLLNGRHQ